jgi:hypothetical protein
MDEPLPPILHPETKPMLKSRYAWTLIAFAAAGLLMAGLVIWQLIESSPGVWCHIADSTDTNLRGACLSVLLKLLDLKDHALMGLLTILGITVVSVVAVALGVKISAAGPGGTNVSVGSEKTIVDNGDAKVEIPTPPSEGKK